MSGPGVSFGRVGEIAADRTGCECSGRPDPYMGTCGPMGCGHKEGLGSAGVKGDRNHEASPSSDLEGLPAPHLGSTALLHLTWLKLE